MSKDLVCVKRALISVSDKTRIENFAKELLKWKIEIVSTGGTASFLKEKGVATNIHYKFPTHVTKAFDDGTILPRTEYVCDNILSLPCYHTLQEHHQDYIIKAIKGIK